MRAPHWFGSEIPPSISRLLALAHRYLRLSTVRQVRRRCQSQLRLHILRKSRRFVHSHVTHPPAACDWPDSGATRNIPAPYLRATVLSSLRWKSTGGPAISFRKNAPRQHWLKARHQATPPSGARAAKWSINRLSEIESTSLLDHRTAPYVRTALTMPSQFSSGNKSDAYVDSLAGCPAIIPTWSPLMTSLGSSAPQEHCWISARTTWRNWPK